MTTTHTNSDKPFIVFVFPTERSDASPRYAGFARRLQQAGGFQGYDIITVALENIAFVTYEDGTAEALDTVSGIDIGSAAFVYLKSWEAMPEEAAALANYLFYKGVNFIDSLPLGMGVSKLATMFRLWGHGVGMPHTVYVRRPDRLKHFLQQRTDLLLGDRFILKDIVGAKGKLNFLVSMPEALEIIDRHPEVQFVCQRFIENDGDYRVGIYAGAPGFIIKRVGSGDSHLNNTSAGGRAEYLPVAGAPQALLDTALRASQAAELQVAGVDVIHDRQHDRWLVLEVNQGSQIVTGAFVDQNIAAFNQSMERLLKDTYAKPHKRPRQVIGRRAVAALPDLGIDQAVAKIDTGAYTSSLHATNIRVETGQDGTPELVFDIALADRLRVAAGKQTHRTKDFSVRQVRSSNGQVEDRYSFVSRLTLEGQTFRTALTLSDRSQMGYPLLVGRRALRSRFIVNVELTERSEPGAVNEA